MLRLNLRPRQSGYSAKPTDPNRSQSLRGGLSRYRTDLVGAVTRVRASWSLSLAQSEAMAVFQRRVEATGEEFELDLIVGEASPRPHVCRLVPGTVKFSSFSGGSCVAEAELEVDALAYAAEDDEARMDLYEGGYQEEADALAFFGLLAELANEDLP